MMGEVGSSKIEITDVDLERVEMIVSNRIREEGLRGTVEVDRLCDLLGRHVVITFRQSLWGEDVGTLRVRYPADWWQAFKQRYAPRWALRRWPVRYTTVSQDVRAVYPDWRPGIEGERVSFVKVPPPRRGSQYSMGEGG